MVACWPRRWRRHSPLDAIAKIPGEIPEIQNPEVHHLPLKNRIIQAGIKNIFEGGIIIIKPP